MAGRRAHEGVVTADLTLDEVRALLAPRIPEHAGFDGWSDAALQRAAADGSIDDDIARLAFAHGAVAMIDAWFAHIDVVMNEMLPHDILTVMKVRERIAALVMARIGTVAPHRDALRRALAILAMPQNAAHGAKLGWRAADAMWRAAGDTATDYNHYSKRAILSGVYAATVLAMLDDESADLAETRAFLDRRIDGIMRFEKAKAGFVARRSHRPSLSRFIGRLRYPAV
jgi:ubiquinone biosynthesis protein COQ9